MNMDAKMDAVPLPSQRNAPSQKLNASSGVERLQYRTADGGMENTFAGSDSHGLQSLVEEWLRPTSAEPTEPAPPANGSNSYLLEEQRWQQERSALEAEMALQRNEASHAIAAARAEGRHEGSQNAEAAMHEERKKLQLQITNALQEFAQERARYFHSVERELVRLALAIAARVLHREARMDPLLLSGAVRVALDQLVDTSGAKLRVSPTRMESWRQLFPQQGTMRLKPEIVADPSLEDGDCVLETRLGTVELGVSAQLEEIEKGFFDLLQHHPQANHAARVRETLSVPSQTMSNARG